MVGVPPMVNALRASVGWSEEQIDHYVFHQASRFMLKNVGRILRISPTTNKLVLGLEGYGNTSSASIPVAMNDQLQNLGKETKNLVMAGFGIGWSWCAVAMPVGPLYLPPVLRVPDEPRPGEFEALTAHEPVGPVMPPKP
jgi:3-oxoacyl-[acyl-carrier-protein] synthase-3